MAKGVYVQKGERIDYKNNGAAAIGYNDVVPLVTIIGVAAEAIEVGATGTLSVAGVYELPAVNNAAFAVGDQLYWDSSAGKVTKVNTGTIPAGWSIEAKADSSMSAMVKIG